MGTCTRVRSYLSHLSFESLCVRLQKQVAAPWLMNDIIKPHDRHSMSLIPSKLRCVTPRNVKRHRLRSTWLSKRHVSSYRAHSRTMHFDTSCCHLASLPNSSRLLYICLKDGAGAERRLKRVGTVAKLHDGQCELASVCAHVDPAGRDQTRYRSHAMYWAQARGSVRALTV